MDDNDQASWSYGWTVSIYFHCQAAMNDNDQTSWNYGWTVSICFHFQAAMNDKGQAFMKLWMNCVNLLSLSGRFEWHFSNLAFGKLNHAILAFRKLMDKPCQFSFWENSVHLNFRKLMDKLCQFKFQEAYEYTVDLHFRKPMDKPCQFSCQEAYG